MPEVKKLLKSVFGYNAFRPLQEEIIRLILERRDSLVIMPTGGGKSLCYQLPALMFKGLTVVVSPLISLMKDQVEQMRELGVRAALLNSSLARNEYRWNLDMVRRNEARLLYLAPETLMKSYILQLLSAITVENITIDEAHCISEWGHDFRPEYRKLADLKKQFHSATCTALTATATPSVRQDIKTCLGLVNCREFVASFNRKNLFLRVIPKDNPFVQTVKFLENFPDASGIIYCFSRQQVDRLTMDLARRGYSVRPYHAGLSSGERSENQDRFICDDVKIMVATIAFGMGINKPDIRFVIHYDLPKNIESYYQEIGRAGRDGLPAHCLLLFSYGDIRKIKYFINQKTENLEKRVAHIHLSAILRYCETTFCRRVPLITYFGESFSEDNCGMCDNCTTPEKELADISISAQKFLSCVKRTGECFGMTHIIDVLRGSKSEKVMNKGHQHLPTYSMGTEYSRKQWSHLCRQFIQQDLLVQDMNYGGLSLTPKAWAVLRGKENVHGLVEADRPTVKRAKKTDIQYDEILFEKLRRLRKKLADDAGLPPYIIFSDRTLIEMAADYPLTKDNLADIHGVGRMKLEKYGSIFLPVIRQYCEDQDINPAPIRRSVQHSTETAEEKKTVPRYRVIGEAYNAGTSISSIMNQYNIKLATVLKHLYQNVCEGFHLRPKGLTEMSRLPGNQQTGVLRAFAQLGTERLRPVYDALEKSIPWEELHLLRLVYLNSRMIRHADKNQKPHQE